MRRFTIGRLMLLIAAVAVELAVLPRGLAVLAAGLTFALPLLSVPARWGVLAVLLVGMLLMPGVSSCGSMRPYQCINNLKQIGLALHEYHAENGCFPPPYVADARGKPLYSWRVLILPYLEQQNLYNAFNFGQPWDGPDNRAITATNIPTFCCPDDPWSSGATNYVAITGPGTAFPAGSAVTFGHVGDGTAETIVVAEVTAPGLHWAEPVDLDLRTMSLRLDDPARPSISSPHMNTSSAPFLRRKIGPAVLFADSRVRRLPRSLSPTTLRALLTMSGGERVQPSELDP